MDRNLQTLTLKFPIVVRIKAEAASDVLGWLERVGGECDVQRGLLISNGYE